MQSQIKLLILTILLSNLYIFKSSNCLAQVPQKFNYQGIARDAKGNPLSQQRMTLKLTVLPTSDATEGEYEEIQTVTTNEFGLYTLQIGAGSPLKGEMSAVKWETGNKYIKVAIDPKGGSDFVEAGTNQLLSVPYAIYADKAGVAKNSGSNTRAANNFIEKTNGSGVVNSTSQIFDNGINIGIGTTSPVARVHVNTAATGVQEHIRMQNTSTTGTGRFTLYNSNPNAYATFTKYGTHYAGGYTGVTSLYPFANLLAFGNNDTNGAGNGRFLVVNEGNTGIGIFKGSTKLKFHIDYATERLGIGGNSVPASNVHLNNTDGSGDTLKLTNNTSGHTTNDGLDILISGTTARIVNKENDSLTLGTNNATRLVITASGNTEINGQLKVKGGTPGAGKVLTSDATGLATWQTPAAASSQWTTSGTNIYSSNTGKVGIGNSIPKAKLDVVSGFDTVGLFRSISVNYIENGVLRAEYSGTNVSDHVAIYGKSIPDSNDYYGVGVKGDGGYTGAQFTGTNKLLADPNGYNAVYGALLSGISDNNATYGSFSFAGQPYGSTNVLGEKTASIHYAQGGEVNTGVNTSAISTPNTTAYGIYSTASGDGNNVAGYFESDNPDAYGVVHVINSNPLTGGEYALFSKSRYNDSTVKGVGIITDGGYVGSLNYSMLPNSYNPTSTPVNLATYNTTQGYYGWCSRNIGSSNFGESLFGIGERYGVQGVAYGGASNVGVYGEVAGPGTPNYTGTSYAGYFSGNVHVNGTLSKAGGTFKIDHPQDPANKYLIHSFVESPDMMNVYNGNIITDASGQAIIELPSYFEAENKDFKYQLTVIGKDSRVFVLEEIVNNQFKVKSSEPNTKISWQVTGVRQDAWANANRVVAVVEKKGEERGKYLYPELFNQPESLDVFANVKLKGRELDNRQKSEYQKLKANDDGKKLPVATPSSPKKALQTIKEKNSSNSETSKTE